jgi:hypothetical protein
MTTDNRNKPNLAQLTHQDDERHLMDYVRVLYKRRWIAIPAFVIVCLVGTINSYRKVTIYEARTQILIEKDTPADAMALYEATFALGDKLYQERLTYAELDAGLNLMAQGSTSIARLAEVNSARRASAYLALTIANGISSGSTSS